MGTKRSASKPTATDRYWPHFAAGWDGNEGTPIRCADCGLNAWVGRSPRDPAAVQVAHLDPADQTWTAVAITCRACNESHGSEPVPHLSPLVYSLTVRDQSRAYVAEARLRTGAEAERRAAARRARRARGQ